MSPTALKYGLSLIATGSVTDVLHRAQHVDVALLDRAAVQRRVHRNEEDIELQRAGTGLLDQLWRNRVQPVPVMPFRLAMTGISSASRARRIRSR